MKQVVVIHGGDTYDTYEAYLASLKNFTVENIDFFRPHPSWKSGLQDALGTAYEVLTPRMPNSNNARYEEWKLWFEKLVPFLDGGVILIGHSLGASFLVRYLAENEFSKTIAATLLVAAPHTIDGDHPLGEFTAPASLSLLEQQGGKLFLYHSKDDKIVSFSELAKFEASLPSATVRVFTDRGHFNQETFPELVADIKSV